MAPRGHIWYLSTMAILSSLTLLRAASDVLPTIAFYIARASARLAEALRLGGPVRTCHEASKSWSGTVAHILEVTPTGTFPISACVHESRSPISDPLRGRRTVSSQPDAVAPPSQAPS